MGLGAPAVHALPRRPSAQHWGAQPQIMSPMPRAITVWQVNSCIREAKKLQADKRYKNQADEWRQRQCSTCTNHQNGLVLPGQRPGNITKPFMVIYMQYNTLISSCLAYLRHAPP
eukprot:366313-Chlamydomonas_euryale.AAC.7